MSFNRQLVVETEHARLSATGYFLSASSRQLVLCGRKHAYVDLKLWLIGRRQWPIFQLQLLLSRRKGDLSLDKRATQGGSLYHFYGGLWYGPVEREPTSYRVRGGHANHLANPRSSGIECTVSWSHLTVLRQYHCNII